MVENKHIIELFSGTESFSKVAREFGYSTLTVDNDLRHKPNICMDINELSITDIPEKFRNPYIIWASPDCSCYSVASIGTHWMGGNKAYIPRTDKALRSLNVCRHTWELIKELNPKYWVIENPRGLLWKMNIFPNEYWKVVWYCQYGDTRAKPTTLNTNIPFVPRICHNGNPDHERAPRGAKTGTQGLKDSVARSVVPRQLCYELLQAVEGDK